MSIWAHCSYQRAPAKCTVLLVQTLLQIVRHVSVLVHHLQGEHSDSNKTPNVTAKLLLYRFLRLYQLRPRYNCTYLETYGYSIIRMITIVKLWPLNREQISVNTAVQTEQSNCGTNCLQRHWRLSPIKHNF